MKKAYLRIRGYKNPGDIYEACDHLIDIAYPAFEKARTFPDCVLIEPDPPIDFDKLEDVAWVRSLIEDEFKKESQENLIFDVVRLDEGD
jgi:hypothetical protein